MACLTHVAGEQHSTLHTLGKHTDADLVGLCSISVSITQHNDCSLVWNKSSRVLRCDWGLLTLAFLHTAGPQ